MGWGREWVEGKPRGVKGGHAGELGRREEGGGGESRAMMQTANHMSRDLFTN